MHRPFVLTALALAAACSGGGTETQRADDTRVAEAPAVEPAAPAPSAQAPLQPPAPGEAGGLPDDRPPVAEAPFAPDSAQGAANVLQSYYALIEQGDYDAAYALRSASADGPSAAEFAASFEQYAEYHAQIGAPSNIEGAAGSLYVEVPVQIYGRQKDGKPFSSAGTVTLRRSNDIPGSTAEQRSWRIYTSG
ncbi:hypothetical protein [Sphingosinicella humi]|uniref:Uncharacterized protein n=1 Tax=Allosphingosinicella humi TaxID=2068657 RepID=A0A2U2J2V1_9SPHN|nr:hypothetical protein [Sphingosinicella humi]PWG02601.1 hypothetical protein DF286_06770 [Sphingosinicella humi]